MQLNRGSLFKGKMKKHNDNVQVFSLPHAACQYLFRVTCQNMSYLFFDRSTKQCYKCVADFCPHLLVSVMQFEVRHDFSQVVLPLRV